MNQTTQQNEIERLRAALEASEKKYQLITENMSDLLSWQDMKGNFTFVSPSVKTLLGYDEEEFTQMNYFDLIFPLDRKKILDTIMICFEEELFPFVFPFRMLHKDGQYVWVETQIQPLKNKNGKFIGSQALTRDITSYKKNEQEIKRNIVKEKELNDLRANFITMASHQFRTPLTVIRSNMELLKMLTDSLDGKLQKKLSKIDGRINKQITKMTALMEDVMLLGKLESGKTPFLPKKQDAISWLKGLIQENFSHQEDGRSVDLTCKIDYLEANYDEKIIGHTLTNLISNAFKYSSKTNQNPKVVVEENDGSVIFSIQDFGIGIPKDEQDNLFQSFYRASNTAEFQGTGLGLVIAKEFIDLHKGMIALESEEGKGTTFWVSIPIERKVDSTEQQLQLTF